MIPDKQVYDEGYVAFTLGVYGGNPYTPGGDKHKEFDRGYNAAYLDNINGSVRVRIMRH